MHQHLSNIISRITTPKIEIVLQTIIVFIFPIFLIRIGVIPVEKRVLVLIILVAMLGAVLIAEKWKPDMLGFEIKTFKKYFLCYAIFTLVGVIALSSFGEKIGHEEVVRWWHYKHFLYLFLVVSFLQEIAYRGYLIPVLGVFSKNPFFIVFANALFFMFLHSIFPNGIIMLPLAFVGGLGFAILYMKYPNIWLVVLSHSVLNFYAVLYGFFVIPGVTY